MRKCFLFFICLFFTFTQLSQAAEKVPAPDTVIKPDAKTPETAPAVALYNFSPDLLKAISACSVYQENFLNLNPELKQKLSATYNIDNPEINIEIQGKEAKLCNLTVQEKFPPVQTEYICQLTEQDLKKLTVAARDRSGKPYTDKILTYPEQNENGTAETPVESSITGSRFYVVWEKIKADSCLQNTSDIAEEPEEAPETAVKNPTDFSTDFMLSLFKCQPDIEEQNISVPEKIEIVGFEDEKCHLRFDDFDLYVPQQLLIGIHSMSDVKTLIRNRDITVYHPQYDYHGLLPEIDECLQNRGTHTAHLQRREVGDAVLISGLTSQFVNNFCEIRLLNQLDVTDSLTDYSVICRISQEDAQFITETYAEFLQEGAEISPDRQKQADNEIMYRLQQGDFCKKIQEQTIRQQD